MIDTLGAVRAFNASNGALIWASQTPIEERANTPSLYGGGIAYDNGRIYATNGLGFVSAIDERTGGILWQVRPGGPLRGAPTVTNGTIYVMSQDNQIYSLKEADGSLNWSQAASLEIAGVFGSASPAVGQGTVVAGFSSGELNAYRYENGRMVWQDALQRTSIRTSVSSLSDIDADPVIDGGQVIALGQGGRMVALEITTGQRMWELNIAGISTPWLAGDWIFVVTDDAKLMCIQRQNGHIRWINQLPQFTTEIDGQNVHFIHLKSAEKNATPLLLIHGWPGSIVEFLDVVGPLTNPVAHGGKAEDAFDVVVPSLPGFGFSGPTREAGWNNVRIGKAFIELMSRLGYQRFGVQGGDAGAIIGPEIGRLAPEAAAALGLDTDCVVAAGLIDAYAGTFGVLGPFAGEPAALERQLALIGGTSSCIVAFSREKRFGFGMWGPYYEAVLPETWLVEGGQSATGALLDHVVRAHSAGGEPTAANHARILARIEVLRAQEGEAFGARLHVLPDFHGN